MCESPKCVNGDTEGEEVCVSRRGGLSRREVDGCCIADWYPRLRRHTIKSRIMQLPKGFVDYLNADGVYLPLEGDQEDGEEEEEDQEEGSSGQAPDFPEVESFVREALSEYGCVFPKLNWSSPRDAVWIMTGCTLKCSSVGDVYLLLKSSDNIQHDLSHCYGKCVVQEEEKPEECFYLALRAWGEVNQSMEFRCFIKNGALVGISQRDHASFYEFLVGEKQGIEDKIVTFYNDIVKEALDIENYVMDVYVKQNGQVIVVDVGPLHEITDPLLFSYEEIDAIEESGKLEFRIIESKVNIQPSSDFGNRLPLDLLEITSGENNELFVELLRRREGQLEEEDSEEEEEEEEKNDQDKTADNIAGK